ncbi:hypothetical protein [Kribbella sp. DT2]|uniref:hypothetical protein n=1 Tax=Kribbella sp. DT2 TaxID=3393427 RepID=UPI003CF858F3
MAIDRTKLANSDAKQTVEFDRPVTGREVVAAMKERCGSKYTQDESWDDRPLIAPGYRSRHNPWQNVYVTPDRETVHFDLDQRYEKVVVQRYEEEFGFSPGGPEATGEDLRDLVVDFGESLKDTIDRLAEAAGAEQARGVAERGVEAGSQPGAEQSAQPVGGGGGPSHDPALAPAARRPSASRQNPAQDAAPGAAKPGIPPSEPGKTW